MNIFFAPDITGDHYVLTPEESHHCVRVLRMCEGDPVQLIDGRGSLFEARVQQANPQRCVLEIDQVHREWGRRGWELTMAVSPTKNLDRWEWFVEKATEVGIDRFVPLICRRSERRDMKTDRTERIVVSAMKQSLKAYKPIVESATAFVELVSQKFEGVKMIAYCCSEQECGDIAAHAKKRYIADCVQPGQSALILIGPEGDFSPEEVTMALANGFLPISLGESRLRTETAAVDAVIEMSLLNR